MVLQKIMTGFAIVTLSVLTQGALAANPFSTKMTDPVIVKELMNTNEGEISLSTLAVEKATSPEVKRFAQSMIQEHQESNRKAMELSKEIKVTPSSNIKTETKSIASQKDVAMLKMKKGKDFDKAYIDTQVKVHKNALEELNQDLIPNAQNGELKKWLTQTAQTVKGHLEQAQKIQTSML